MDEFPFPFCVICNHLPAAEKLPLINNKPLQADIRLIPLTRGKVADYIFADKAEGVLNLAENFKEIFSGSTAVLFEYLAVFGFGIFAHLRYTRISYNIRKAFGDFRLLT